MKEVDLGQFPHQMQWYQNQQYSCYFSNLGQFPLEMQFVWIIHTGALFLGNLHLKFKHLNKKCNHFLKYPKINLQFKHCPYQYQSQSKKKKVSTFFIWFLLLTLKIKTSQKLIFSNNRTKKVKLSGRYGIKEK